MRLSGWQRLGVLLAILWTIVVGLLTWNTWPATYLSSDPKAGIPLPPVGSDVTLHFDGVIKANEPLTVPQFAARLKAKYPEYRDLEDAELVTRILDKYPDYRPYIVADDFEPDPPEDVSRINRESRIAAAQKALMFWLLPIGAVFGLGYGVAWVVRGFKSQSP